MTLTAQICRVFILITIVLLGLTAATSRCEAETVSLEILFSEETNEYSWNFFDFGGVTVESAISPGGSQDFGFFSTLEDLNNDISTGLWDVTTDGGSFTFQLDSLAESDFNVPTLLQPVDGETYVSGSLIPFDTLANDADFVSRGFFNSSDLEGTFEPGGIRATLNPGVVSAPFNVFAIGFISTEAFDIDDPNGVFSSSVDIGGETATVGLTIVAVPEPAAVLPLCSLGLACVAVRRRRKVGMCQKR